MELKGPNGFSEKVPLGQLPVLELDNGQLVCQSLSILKFAGKLSKLYPEDPVKALYVDEFIETIMELYNAAPGHADAEEKLKLRKAWIDSKGPKYFSALERMVARNGGPYLLGKEFSIADLVILRIVGAFLTGDVDGVPKEYITSYRGLVAAQENASKHPIALAEIAKEAEAKAKAAATATAKQ